MKDIEILLENIPGTLATMGEILGKNKISLEGGGVFQNGNMGIAHFLVEEGELARHLLLESNIQVEKLSDVLIVKLRQDIPGQLGLFCRRLAEEGINILVQYSDHSNQLILVVDNYKKGSIIVKNWMKEWW